MLDPVNQALSQIFAGQGRVILIVSAILLLMAEFGWQMGKWMLTNEKKPYIKQVDGVKGSVFTIMALLLGFTFAMALQKYDFRERVIQEEANAIGTAFLRASFLPPSARQESESLFRRYVDLRIKFMEDQGSPLSMKAHRAEVQRIQGRLWEIAAEVGQDNPSRMIPTYVQALNAVFDLDALHLSSLRRRVPGTAWLLLFVVASLGCWASGYSSGRFHRRLVLSQVAWPLLIAVAMTLVADLDRPRYGVVGLDEQGLQELQKSMNEAPQ